MSLTGLATLQRQSDANRPAIEAESTRDLQRQAAQLSHLLDVMPAGVLVINGSGYVQRANRQAQDLLGEPLEGQLWRQVIQRGFQPQADDGHEVSLKDGRKVKLSIEALQQEPGQLILITDLTETRQLQQRVSHMQRLSSLGRMVASLAHQVRTPLSAAMLYAANLTNATLAGQARQQFAGKLLARLQELESQVNDMLLFAKSGEQQVVAEIDVAELLAELRTSLEPMLMRQQAELAIQADNLRMLGNRTALLGALQNLVHNALQARPQGAEIKVSAQVSAADASQLHICVSDNGPGISQADQAKVFEPFFTTRSHGTGLGLAVVKTVAQSHQGQVAIYSEPGQGTKITLVLPLLANRAQDLNNPQPLVANRS